MKILLIETLGDGGIAHYSYNLMRALIITGSDVRLVTTRIYELKGAEQSDHILPFYFKLAFKLIQKFPKLSQETFSYTILRRIIKVFEYPLNTIEVIVYAKKNNIDIVHFQTIHMFDLIMACLFRVFKFNCIYTVHNVIPVHRELTKLKQVLYRYLYRFFDAFIIHSHISKKEFLNLYHVDSEKIYVIPHGNYKFLIPETPMSKGDAKAKLGISLNKKILLFFGAIRENKGLNDLIIAMKRVVETVPNAVLLIAGEPLKDYGKYKALINKLELDSNIIEMLEYIPNDEIPSLFYASDVVMLPYHEISQSGVLQLAYAFSKPVIASSVGGFPEAVEDGRNGFLVPANCPDILAAKTIELFQNEDSLQRMGEYSYSIATTKYSWKAIADKTRDVYKKIMDA